MCLNLSGSRSCWHGNTRIDKHLSLRWSFGRMERSVTCLALPNSCPTIGHRNRCYTWHSVRWHGMRKASRSLKATGCCKYNDDAETTENKQVVMWLVLRYGWADGKPWYKGFSSEQSNPYSYTCLSQYTLPMRRPSMPQQTYHSKQLAEVALNNLKFT